MRTIAERVAGFISPIESGCHIWIGPRTSSGYGRLFIRSQAAQRWYPRMAHRLTYEAAFGPVPIGLELDHLCRVPLCVNPAHLEPVTHAENMRRSPFPIAATNRVKTHCHRGHEFDELNTRLYQGRRNCRKCHVISTTKQARRRRAAAKEISDGH